MFGTSTRPQRKLGCAAAAYIWSADRSRISYHGGCKEAPPATSLFQRPNELTGSQWATEETCLPQLVHLVSNSPANLPSPRRMPALNLLPLAICHGSEHVSALKFACLLNIAPVARTLAFCLGPSESKTCPRIILAEACKGTYTCFSADPCNPTHLALGLSVETQSLGCAVTCTEQVPSSCKCCGATCTLVKLCELKLDRPSHRVSATSQVSLARL